MSQDPQYEDEPVPSVQGYIWAAVLAAGLVFILGSQALLGRLAERPELVQGDQAFVWGLKALSGIGALAVVAALWAFYRLWRQGDK